MADKAEKAMVNCVVCEKRLVGVRKLNGSYRVASHKNPRSHKSCPGSLSSSHKPVPT